VADCAEENADRRLFRGDISYKRHNAEVFHAEVRETTFATQRGVVAI
jgi:hypothetical protein